jgi:hypothetical protein
VNRLYGPDLGEMLLQGRGGWILRPYGVVVLVCGNSFEIERVSDSSNDVEGIGREREREEEVKKSITNDTFLESRV